MSLCQMKITRKLLPYLILALTVNVLIVLILSIWQHNYTNNSHDTRSKKQILDTFVEEAPRKNKANLTIIIQDFENFENYISNITRLIITSFTYVRVLIVSNQLPYPPIVLPKSDNIKLITLKDDLRKRYNDSHPISQIKTDYVLFLPDGLLIDTNFGKLMPQFVTLMEVKNLSALALGVKSSHLTCQPLLLKLKEWTLEFSSNKGSSVNCDLVQGEHGLFIKTKDLYKLANPFLIPTFTSLYLQLKVTKMKIHIWNDKVLEKIGALFSDAHNLWKHKQNENIRLNTLYAKFGIKKVIRTNGLVEWYGCTKHTERCFGNIENDMPDFLYDGKWTPPCCLNKLRETAKHVFSILEACQVRYWLEGGSLLGAARHNDIIPWDYDIDIGIYKEDVLKCSALASINVESYVDDDGFVWEKAIEGDFLRVQYSQTNRLHVDIFPFYSRNGTMTKDTWFRTHRQDMEFPEKFLQPLTKIKFAGLEASAPNNVTEFLELKFGKGVIENPKYPNLQFPYDL
ncbi:hypothetical protein ACJMK2_043752 [Sinanodonta woodiana]|uniref:Fukutin-related protein n=1 Tax=Sinanodonta woodiana TaxID=1069815 RepID=A0ABD3VZ69_SINWO